LNYQVKFLVFRMKQFMLQCKTRLAIGIDNLIKFECFVELFHNSFHFFSFSLVHFFLIIINYIVFISVIRLKVMFVIFMMMIVFIMQIFDFFMTLWVFMFSFFSLLMLFFLLLLFLQLIYTFHFSLALLGNCKNKICHKHIFL